MKTTFTRHMPEHMIGRARAVGYKRPMCLCHKRWGVVDGKCPHCGKPVDKYHYTKRPYS